MSEQWMGLHNPDRHSDPTTSVYGITYCDCQGSSVCEPDGPCYCCLYAEVEALRAQVRVLELCAESEATRGNEYEAQAQAVREVCRDPARIMRTTAPLYAHIEWVDLNAVLNALDGDGDE